MSTKAHEIEHQSTFCNNQNRVQVEAFDLPELKS